jgi:hypothetical protein
MLELHELSKHSENDMVRYRAVAKLGEIVDAPMFIPTSKNVNVRFTGYDYASFMRDLSKAPRHRHGVRLSRTDLGGTEVSRELPRVFKK